MKASSCATPSCSSRASRRRSRSTAACARWRMRLRISPSTPTKSDDPGGDAQDVAEVDVLRAERREERVVELGERRRARRRRRPSAAAAPGRFARRARPTAAVDERGGGRELDDHAAELGVEGRPVGVRRAHRGPDAGEQRGERDDHEAERARADSTVRGCTRSLRDGANAAIASITRAGEVAAHRVARVRRTTRRRRRSARRRESAVAARMTSPAVSHRWSARERSPHWRSQQDDGRDRQQRSTSFQRHP